MKADRKYGRKGSLCGDRMVLEGTGGYKQHGSDYNDEDTVVEIQ
jgi:hypothetical protein